MCNKTKIFALFLLSLLSLAPVFAGERLAVIIGINEYDMLAKLNAAVNDAERMSQYYSNLGFRVWTLSDRQESRMNKPSLANFERILTNLKEISDESPVDELVFFFAGHGVQIGGTNYVCFPETEPISKTGMVSVDATLVPWLRDMKAGLTMVYLDACRNDLGPVRAAGITRGLDLNVGSNAGLKKTTEGLTTSMAVFYASKSGEFSYEKADGSGGFFTDTLLEALNADSTSTVGELFDYIRKTLPTKTETAYGQMQVPRLGGDLDLQSRFSKGKVDSSLLDTGGRLYVKANVPGAEIWINGVKMGMSPLFVDGLAPGSTMVEAKTDGYYASTQVSIVRKVLGQVTLDLKEIRGNVLVSSLGLSTNPNADKGDVDKIMAGMKVLVDGQNIGELSGTLIPNLQTGSYTIALASPSWFWEQCIEIKGNDTAKVEVSLIPVGKISWKVPEGAEVVLVRKDTAQEFHMDNIEGTEEYMPSGEYLVKYRGEHFNDAESALTLIQGQSVTLMPNLIYTARWQNNLYMQRLTDEITVQTNEYSNAKVKRAKLNTLGHIALAVGGCLAVGSGITYALAADNFNKYQSSAVSSDATSFRKATGQFSTIGLCLGIGGGTFLLGSLTSALIGPHPQKTQEKIELLETSLAEAHKKAGEL